GVPIGTGLAFMMAIVGLSLPEAMILKRVLRLPLLAAFFGIVTVGIIVIGYVINVMF
ncbi:permease, partial [Candidatus Parcubacteria bacterium]|nr:permease [Candidatus Parcubacteria bacterium]